MKSIFTIFAAICLLQSCRFGDSTDVKTDSTVVYRDTSITAANAYSDLFLDSNTVSSYIQHEKPDTAVAQMLRNFYMVRNNQFAWFNSQGFTEEGRNFWTSYAGGGDSPATKGNSLREHLDTLLQKDSVRVGSNDSAYIRAELALTQRFIQYAQAGKGPVNRNNVYHIVPCKKMDALQLADSILNKQKDSTMLASNKTYAAMKQHLALYYKAAKSGGWQPVPAAGLKKGASSPAVVALKKRLQATNDYQQGDTSNMFSDSLVAAIKDVQQRNGLAPTGVVNDSLTAILNVPAQERVQQILLNMNRMVWMPSTAEANRIEVNIPSQMLYAYEGNNKVLEMPVIVGKEGTSTVAFTGSISQVVFNPTWNLPESIVKNEIMPAMKNDPGYLKKKNMEVVNQGSDSVPVIKQLPGKDNPLGKVKFLFPNSFDIYLHDTPDKTLFRRNDRALSHGCIRVADAEKLAQYILRDQKDWTPEKIHAAMNGNKEQAVAVSSKAPVQISYLSAWVDPAGKLNFRNDVGGRDKQTLARLFNYTAFPDVAKAGVDSVNISKSDSLHPGKDVAGKRKAR